MRTLVIIGNGPSMKDTDIDAVLSLDSFGLNAAYRQYEKIGKWPKYYGCFDCNVVESHSAQWDGIADKVDRLFLELIMPAPSIKASYLAFQRWGMDYPETFGDIQQAGDSGITALMCGLVMGYDRFLLCGVDCSWDEHQPFFDVNGEKVVASHTPDRNDSYWFDNYQVEGDKFSLPRGDENHRPAWNKLRDLSLEHGFEVVNCSPRTTIDCFPMGEIEDFTH